VEQGGTNGTRIGGQQRSLPAAHWQATSRANILKSNILILTSREIIHFYTSLL
jgi:hypothetical protein